MHARPVSPTLPARRHTSSGSEVPMTRKRCPSFSPHIETASGSSSDLRRYRIGNESAYRTFTHAPAPRRRRLNLSDDIVACCEESAENRRSDRETRHPAGRDGSCQHDHYCRGVRHPPRPCQADRIVDADGHRAPRKTHRRALAADQGFRAARRRSDDVVFGGWDIFEDNCVRGGQDRRRARRRAAAARFVRSSKPSSRCRRCSIAATSSGSTAPT